MTIAAVSTVLNEADIVEKTIRHLFAEGVDTVWIAHGPSTDGTDEILDRLLLEYPGLHVVKDDSDIHLQPRWISGLAEIAGLNGADWILPFDADEIWYATNGHTIADTLTDLSPDVRKLHVRSFQHRDWDHREVVYRALGKVAFRWQPGVRVMNGNHDCTVPGTGMVGVLDLRELQFRSFEHMLRKSRERVARLDPTIPLTDGVHQRRLVEMSDEQLVEEWARMQSVAVVYDPIPVRS